MTTLSEQLKRLAVPQTQVFRPESNKRASFLFDPKEAAGHDKETVFSFGVSGLQELIEIDANFAQFEKTLFNESSMSIQRAVLTREENEKLNTSLEKFLLYLTPYFPLRAAHKALEWLIYRFNVHTFNVDAVMRCILPYNATNLFVRMLQILDISEKDSLWYWLVSLRKSGRPLTRQQLINHCSTNLGFVSYVCDIVARVADEFNEHEAEGVRVLFTFYASLMCGTIMFLEVVGEAFVAQLIPHILTGLRSNNCEYMIASYMILSQLALKIKLKQEVCEIFVKNILRKMRPELTYEALATVVVLCQTQIVEKISSKVLTKLALKEEKLSFVANCEKLSQETNIDKFFKLVVHKFIELCFDVTIEEKNRDAVWNTLNQLIRDIKQEHKLAFDILLLYIDKYSDCLKNGDEHLETFEKRLSKHCALLFRRYPTVFDNVMKKCFCKDEIGKTKFFDLCDITAQLPGCFDKLVLDNELPEEVLPTDIEIKTEISPIPRTVKKQIVSLFDQHFSRKELKKFSTFFNHLNEVIKRFSGVEKFRSDVVPKKRKKNNAEVEPMNDVVLSSSDNFKLLTSLLEFFIETEELDRSDTLIGPLFAAIKICLDFESKEGIDYVLQLTLHCIQSVCEGHKTSKILLKDFDVELLVRVIRHAERPGTHQHAFELLSIVAPIFKENFVVRLMPVFTFMGKNLFRRDDSYSFQVIYRTIDSIIPPILHATPDSKLFDVVVKIFRDFANSAVHIPEHRRLGVLTKLVQSCITNVASDADVLSTVRCKNLWVLVALLIDYHIMHWNKDAKEERERGNPKDLHPAIEFCLSLCFEFSSVDQMFCVTNLIKYISKIPDDLSKTNVLKRNPMGDVFELKTHSEKQIRHFKYEVMGFVSHFLGCEPFVAKLAELNDEQFRKISPICEYLIIESMQILNQCTKMTELHSSNETLSKFWKAILYRSKSCLDKLNSLFPAEIILNLISLLLRKEEKDVKLYSLELLNGKLLQTPTPFTSLHVDQLCAIAEMLTGFLSCSNENHNDIILVQSAFFTLKLLTRVTVRYNSKPFEEILRRTVNVLHNWRNSNKLVVGNAVLCLADLVTGLDVQTLPLMSTFVSDLLSILIDKDFISGNDLLVVSCLTCVQKVVETLSKFLSSYLPDLLRTIGRKTLVESASVAYKNQIQTRISCIKKHLSNLPTRVLLPAIEANFREFNQQSLDALPLMFAVLTDNIAQSSSDDIASHVSSFESVFLIALKLRAVYFEKDLDEICSLEDSVMNTFLKLSLKLSESHFRPFFTNLTDWATDNNYRLITLFRLSNKLADQLRSLFLLFAANLVKLSADLISRMNHIKKANVLFENDEDYVKTNLLLCELFDFVNKCGQYDTQSFINRQRFDMLISPIVDQLENLSLKPYKDRVTNHLIPCVVNLAVSIRDDSAWKALNYEVLLKTRHRKSKVRIAALQTVEKLYDKLREDVSTLVPDTVPFLAELMEDESEDVERQCQSVIGVLEAIVGESLKDYF